jgi:hypothetical protein
MRFRENDITCTYRGIDIEKVRKDSENYRKYAYRKGSSHVRDVTITTKLSNPPDKKLQNMQEAQFKKYDHNGTKSRTSNAICYVTGDVEDEIYGFAAPFKYYSPDKPAFIRAFFHKEKFSREYPVSSKEAFGTGIWKNTLSSI